MTKIPLQGSLAETPVPRLLLELFRDRYSGGVVLESQRTQKQLLFHEGAPVSAQSQLASESLCGQLVTMGVLGPEDVARVEQATARKGHPESSALLELRLLQPRDLFAALKEQVRRRTVACFGWTEGSYALQPDETPGENLQPFRADPLALVQEGLESAWGVDRMLQALAPQLERFPVSTRALGLAVLRLQTDEITDAMLARLDGSTRLSEVLAPAVRSPRALAAAWVIDAAGLLEYREQALELGEEKDEPEIQIELADAPQAPAQGSPRAPEAVSPAASAAADRREGSAREKTHSMQREILDRLEAQRELDLYGVLELERNASAAEIRKAYFKAAKRYHPDSLARLGLDSLKQEAAAVFSRMAEAYEVLSDSQKRSDYDLALESGMPEIDTAALAQAETSFRKGEILVKMGDFRGALQFLEHAVKLWPEEAAYQSALGWALYKKNPPEPERAREHLEHALSLAPEDPIALFRSGMVLRALGETDAAQKALARAKLLDPSASEGS